MHALVAPQSASRRRLATQLLMEFERYGYEYVVPPLFEPVDTLERLLPQARGGDFLRFIDPSNGRVVALRPDFTPQIARIVATQLRSRPGPFRLSYEGAVLRRGDERTTGSEKIDQAGIELIGAADLRADAEVIEAMYDACLKARSIVTHAVDIDRQWLHLEVGHVAFPSYFLPSDPTARQALQRALSRKDQTAIAEEGARHRVLKRDLKPLFELCELYGDRSTLRRAHRRHRGVAALTKIIDRLERLLEQVEQRLGDIPALVDLGKLPTHTYYTGICFNFLARGPGRPVATGGRYDELLQRLPRIETNNLPACGGAVDVSALEEAIPLDNRSRARSHLLPAVRIALSGSKAAELAPKLRGHGHYVVELDHNAEETFNFARHWGYDVAVFANGTLIRAKRIVEEAVSAEKGDALRVSMDDIEALIEWI